MANNETLAGVARIIGPPTNLAGLPPVGTPAVGAPYRPNANGTVTERKTLNSHDRNLFYSIRLQTVKTLFRKRTSTSSHGLGTQYFATSEQAKSLDKWVKRSTIVLFT